MKTNVIIFLFLVIDGFIILFLLLTHGTAISPGILSPAGPIASAQKELLTLAFFLAMLIIIPVFTLFFFISKHYKEGKKASYLPDWTPRFSITLLWWIIPAIIISIIAGKTWFATHALDPYKPLVSDKTPVRIQVVALRWKWLFIYPEEKIATVNFVQFSEDRPITFELTADAPMNSFWIPRLSGQIYAMTGMTTKIHMQADTRGDYQGSTAEISGTGFSGMRFLARASSEAEYANWVAKVKQSPKKLDLTEYNRLVLPSEHAPHTFYVLTQEDLYNEIINKFMPEEHDSEQAEGMQH